MHQQVFKNSLRSKIKLFSWLIISALLTIPLVAILLYIVNVDDSIICTGTVIPQHTYDLAANFDGPVKELYFRTGDQVRKGDLIVQMDDTEYQNELRKVEAAITILKSELMVKKSELFVQLDNTELLNTARKVEAAIQILKSELQVKKNEIDVLLLEPLPENYRHSAPRLDAALEADKTARQNLQNYKTVLTKIEFSKYEKEARDARVERAIREENDRIVKQGLGVKIIEKARNEMGVIRNQIAEKEVELAILRKRIEDCKISAVVDGTILELPCKRARYVDRGKPAVIMGSPELTVRAEVDSRFIRKVRLGQDAEISSDIFSRLQYGHFYAVVEKISEVPLENTTKYPVYLSLNTEECDFKVGSKAEVRIITGTAPAIYAFLNITKDDETMKRLQEKRRREAQNRTKTEHSGK